MSTALRWPLAGEGEPSLLDGLVERMPGRGELAGLELLHVEARTVINEVPAASRMPFRYTVNPYRGCSHACVYCFARTTHEYLGMSRGRDFDRKSVLCPRAGDSRPAPTRDPTLSLRGCWSGPGEEVPVRP